MGIGGRVLVEEFITQGVSMKPGTVRKYTNTAKTAKRKLYNESISMSRRWDNPKHTNKKGQTLEQQWDLIKDSDDFDYIQTVISDLYTKSTCTCCSKTFTVVFCLPGNVKLCVGCTEMIYEYALTRSESGDY